MRLHYWLYLSLLQIYLWIIQKITLKAKIVFHKFCLLQWLSFPTTLFDNFPKKQTFWRWLQFTYTRGVRVIFPFIFFLNTNRQTVLLFFFFFFFLVIKGSFDIFIKIHFWVFLYFQPTYEREWPLAHLNWTRYRVGMGQVRREWHTW